MKNALVLENVTKQYKEFKLDNINLTVPCGSIMGLVGENGAGKSTTIKLILDLIKRDSGTITVLGEDNQKNGKTIKEKLGVVLDESCFAETLTYRDINRIMKNIFQTWHADVFSQYMNRFKLSSTKTIKEYSRGMKMKLAISVALSHEAQLLVLDEATSGLDPIIRDEILDVFLEFIQDEHHAILVSSHIVSDLEKICDYITFIHQGKMVFSETTDELTERYGVLKCSVDQFKQLDKQQVIGYRENKFGVEALVLKEKIDHQYVVDRASIEDIMLYHVKGKRI
jgi:ABC-2 type transport system ATP-binding protein